MGKRAKIHKCVRLAVYRRDKWTCQYCGLRILPRNAKEEDGRNAPWISRNGYVWLELDHIQPVLRGGDDSIENLRAACTPCNKAKLASTRETDWSVRIAFAVEILTEGEPSRKLAERAIEALLGERMTIVGVKPKRKGEK